MSLDEPEDQQQRDREADWTHAQDMVARQRRHLAREAAGSILAPLRDIQDNPVHVRREIFDAVAYGLTPGALAELISDLIQAETRRSPEDQIKISDKEDL